MRSAPHFAHRLGLGALIGLSALAFCQGARAVPVENPALAQLARAAEGDTLNLIVHSVPGHEATAREFQRRFPKVHVRITVQNPSTMAPRVLTEQQHGVYAWDSWWAATSVLETSVRAAGGFEPITKYMVLPEVKDPSMWRAPRYQYTSDHGPYVFIQSLNVEPTLLFNREVIKGFDVRSARDLLDPRLKGLIALRAPVSGSNAGAYALASLYREQGPEFLRRLLTEQHPVIIENGRQLTDGALRGDYAVAIGADGNLLNRCQMHGGCRQARMLPFGTSILSRGVAVLKNPPHPAATRLWINWFLSREGQEVYVREWAKQQSTGAVSMRRDVMPDPRHIKSVPDYNHLEQAGLYGLQAGLGQLAQSNAFYEKTEASIKPSLSLSARVVSVLGLLAIAILVVRAVWSRLAAARRRGAGGREGRGRRPHDGSPMAGAVNH